MKLAFWDIETAKMQLSHQVYDLKMYSKYLPADAITRPRWMPCASWKLQGKDHVHSVSVLDDPKRFKKDYSDDYHVVKSLSDMMQTVDAIVAHNGDQFDWKILTARLLYHGLPPIPRVQTVDTLKIARTQFRLESNSLRYLAWYLKLSEQKDKTPDWNLVSAGDTRELEKCLRYNRIDVRVLERVYDRLAPFSKIKLYYGDEQCPLCGSQKYHSKGRSHTGRNSWCYQCAVPECSKRWNGKPPKTQKLKGAKE